VDQEAAPITSPEVPSSPRSKEFRTADVKCLSCGAYNIPENKICGACGANLPLVYGKDGKVFHWESDSPYWEALHPSKKKGGLGVGTPSGWTLRVAVVLLAVIYALWVLAHRS